MRPSLPLALALLGPLLHADGLADLKAALKALPAPAKVHVRIEEDGRELEEGKEQVEHRTALVEDGPGGTRVLEDSRPAERRKGSGDKGADRKDSGDFREALRPGEELLEQLGKAKLLEEKAETREGRPVRRLKLALDLNLDAEARSHVKQAEHEATVWIGPDNLPLAMDQRIEVRARVLLFASVWTKIEIHRRFQRAQNRLLLLDETAEVQGSALGKAFSSRDTTRCSLVP